MSKGEMKYSLDPAIKRIKKLIPLIPPDVAGDFRTGAPVGQVVSVGSDGIDHVAQFDDHNMASLFVIACNSLPDLLARIEQLEGEAKDKDRAFDHQGAVLNAAQEKIKALEAEVARLTLLLDDHDIDHGPTEHVPVESIVERAPREGPISVRDAVFSIGDLVSAKNDSDTKAEVFLVDGIDGTHHLWVHRAYGGGHMIDIQYGTKLRVLGRCVKGGKRNA